MLTVTPVATERIKSIMAEQDEEGASLRIMIAGMGCGGPQYMMTLEHDSNEDDVKIEQDGITVLIDAESVPMIEGAEIDYVETLEHSGFTVNNPNFKGGGGCGEGCGCGHGG